MKKNYLKPELETVIELPSESMMLDLSPTDEDKPGGDDTPGGGFGAPRWKKW